jgi:hypothetical protein
VSHQKNKFAVIDLQIDILQGLDPDLCIVDLIYIEKLDHVHRSLIFLL